LRDLNCWLKVGRKKAECSRLIRCLAPPSGIATQPSRWTIGSCRTPCGWVSDWVNSSTGSRVHPWRVVRRVAIHCSEAAKRRRYPRMRVTRTERVRHVAIFLTRRCPPARRHRLHSTSRVGNQRPEVPAGEFGLAAGVGISNAALPREPGMVLGRHRFPRTRRCRAFDPAADRIAAVAS